VSPAARAGVAAGWAALASACFEAIPVDPDATTVHAQPAPPDVVAADLACDLDADQWTLWLELSGWGGRVRSWWSADGLYVEDHLVPSVAYAEDGSGQEYQLQLSISSDFRLVEEGDATALSCAADPSVHVVIEDLDGEVHDCVTFPGPAVDWAAIDDVPTCVPGARRRSPRSRR